MAVAACILDAECMDGAGKQSLQEAEVRFLRSITGQNLLHWIRNGQAFRYWSMNKEESYSHLVTPGSNVLLERTIVAQLDKNSHLRTLKIYYFFHSSRSGNCTLKQLNRIHNITFCFLEIQFNIILPSISGSPK